jgi:hypothetical protein
MLIAYVVGVNMGRLSTFNSGLRRGTDVLLSIKLPDQRGKKFRPMLHRNLLFAQALVLRFPNR